MGRLNELGIVSELAQIETAVSIWKNERVGDVRQMFVLDDCVRIAAFAPGRIIANDELRLGWRSGREDDSEDHYVE
jgi:hypothetical protein